MHAKLLPGGQDAISRERIVARHFDETDVHQDPNSRFELRRRVLKLLGVSTLAALFPAHRSFAAGLAVEPQSGKYPRAFAFRQSEVLATRLSLEDWESNFKQLGGVVGKLLQEERKDSVNANNIAYFRHLKTKFPRKMCLMHFNSMGRLPDFETENWYPGWWLRRASLPTLGNTSRNSGTITVGDLNGIELVADGFGNSWQDLMITRADVDGKPDFGRFEYARMTAFDSATGTLTLDRGAYGSTARYWPTGSLVAPIVTSGPFYQGGDKLWFYNYATTCPQDLNGMQAADAILAGLDAHIQTDLDFLDGIELDVFVLKNAIRTNIDTNGDGLADQGLEAGEDLVLKGMDAFLGGLRGSLGPDRLLLTDGGGNQRPNINFVNGVELEGTPRSTDLDFLLWSQAVESLRYYRKYATKRSFALGSGQEISSTFSYNTFRNKPVTVPPKSFSNFRLALATSLVSSSALTFFFDPVAPGSTTGLPPGPNGGQFDDGYTIWDELVGGDLGQAGWLGRPLGATQHVIDFSNDLYARGGINLTTAFTDAITRSGGTDMVRDTDQDGVARLSFTRSSPSGSLKFDLPVVNVSGPDLTLAIRVQADPRDDIPAGAARFLRITLKQDGAQTQLISIPVGPDWQTLHLSFRRLVAGSATIGLAFEKNNGVRIRRVELAAAPDLVTREFQNGVVFGNPSDQPALFPVSSLYPGASFSRLIATPDQDTAVNDGSPVSDILEVPPIDALIVRRTS